MSISVLFRLKNVVKVNILFTGKCKTKLSMCYSLQTSADGRYEYVFNSKVKLKSDIFCVVEVLWERHTGSVMFYLLDMAHER